MFLWCQYKIKYRKKNCLWIHCGMLKLLWAHKKKCLIIARDNAPCVTSYGYRSLWFGNYWVSKMTYLGFHKFFHQIHSWTISFSFKSSEMNINHMVWKKSAYQLGNIQINHGIFAGKITWSENNISQNSMVRYKKNNGRKVLKLDYGVIYDLLKLSVPKKNTSSYVWINKTIWIH